MESDQSNQCEVIELGIVDWETFIKDADKDRDGKITKEEFVNYVEKFQVDAEKVAGCLFSVLDADGDGSVTLDEYQDVLWDGNPHIFKVLGFGSFADMKSRMDENKDGKVDKEEFINFLVKAHEDGTFLRKSKKQRVR